MKVGVSLLRGKLQNTDSRHSVKRPMMDLHWGLGPKYPVMNITFELDTRFLKMEEYSLELGLTRFGGKVVPH